jgi:hypothetical protein
MKWAIVIGVAAFVPAVLAAQSANVNANTVGKVTETSTVPSVVPQGSDEHRRLVAFLAATQSSLTGLGPTHGDFHVLQEHQQVTPAGAAHQPIQMPPPPYDANASSAANNVGDTLSIDICSDGTSQAWRYVFSKAEAEKTHGHAPGWKIQSYSAAKDCATQP